MTKKQKGILFILCSAFCFALMNTFVRLAGDVPTIQKSFFRNIVSVVFAMAVIVKDGNEGFRYNKRELPLLFLRSAAGTVGILCNFYAIDHMNLSDASMLNKLSPFFAIIFSVFMLKEKPKLYQTVCVMIAFLGSLFIIKPSIELSEMGPALIGAIGGMGAGCAYTAVRALGMSGVKGAKIVLFFSAFSCIVVLPFVIFNYQPMTIWQFLSLMVAGLCASGGQFAVTAAYTNAPAREISVFDYSQVIFAALLGFALFAQIPDIYSIIGYFIICGVSVIMFLKNRNN